MFHFLSIQNLFREARVPSEDLLRWRDNSLFMMSSQDSVINSLEGRSTREYCFSGDNCEIFIMLGWSWCKSIKKRQRISVRTGTETGALPGSNWFKSTTWPLIDPSEGNHPNWQNSCHQSNVVWLNYSHFSLLDQLAFKQKIAFDETRNHKLLFLFSMKPKVVGRWLCLTFGGFGLLMPCAASAAPWESRW